MAATNALLAFGGMTQHCRRWGWRMFFLVSAQSSSRWRDRQFGVPRPFSPTTAGQRRRKNKARAMGRKNSDEFVVPLCRTHHRQNHQVGDEVSWWKQTKIDPLKVALRLWQVSRGVIDK